MVDTVSENDERETGNAHVKVVARPRRGARPSAGRSTAPPERATAAASDPTIERVPAPTFEEPARPAGPVRPARTSRQGRTVVVNSATTPIVLPSAPEPLPAREQAVAEEPATAPTAAPRRSRRPAAGTEVAEPEPSVAEPPAATAALRALPVSRVVVSSATTPLAPLKAPDPVIAEVEDREAEGEVRRDTPLRTLAIMLTAVVVAMLLNSTSLLHSAEQMKPGAGRTILLAIARPVDRFARDAHLTAPRHALDRALGRAATAGTGSGPGLDEVAVPTDVGGAPLTDSAASAPASVPPPPVAATSAPPPAPPAFHPKSLRTVDPQHPMTLWVTGDSQITYLGDNLLARTASAHTVKTFNPDTHIGTGLVRPDTFDWLKYARAGIARRKPDAVVITMGGNDFQQGIPAGPGKAWPAGSAGWKLAYQARAKEVMLALTGNGQRPVYWVTTPDVKDKGDNAALQVEDQAVIDAAASVPGVIIVDARPVLSPQGHYSAYRGTTLIREGDGIHATFAGSALVADAVLAALNADWHLTK